MSKRSFHLFITSIIGLMFVLGDVLVLYAEETKSDEFTLEEITVTAQKRVENQQKVPISMDAISGDELALSGKNNVDDILRDLSNVSIYTSQDGMRVSIRGITDNGSDFNNIKTSASLVGVNLDGVQNSGGNAGQNLFDVERVEVLYGPQSTLYGSNSPGGIVNIVTASPKTDKYSASIGVNYGSFDSLNLQGVLNVPVIKDKVAIRLAISNSKENSWFSGSTGSKNTSARLKMLWQPNDNLSVTVTPSWAKNSNGGMMGDSVRPFDYQDGSWWGKSAAPPGEPAQWINNGKVTDPWTKADAQGGPPGGGNSNDQITKGLSGDINWTASFGTIAFVPSYSKSSASGTMTDPNNNVFNTDNFNKQTGAELRITNSEDFTLFQWIVGATYNKSEQGMDNIAIDPTVDSQISYATSTKKALYANITYPFWFYENLALVMGYRQSWDKMDSFFDFSMPGGPAPTPTHGNFSKPDIKVGFNWDAENNLMLYGSYASSYRGVNAQAPRGTENSPETMKSYTIGAKSRAFDNKLQLNASLYYYKYHNKYDQTEAVDAFVNIADWVAIYPTIAVKDDGTGHATLEGRGMPVSGDFNSLGVDLSVSWIITSADRLSFNLSHLDSKWTSLTRPADDTYPLIFPERSYKNVTNFNSPKWSLTANYEHNFEVGSWGTLTPSIDAQYKSSTWLSFTQADGDPHGLGFQEGYYLINGAATFNHASGIWSANFSVKNIMNYAAKRSYFTQGGGSLRIGDPRTYLIGLNIKF
jgi:iron complex outermembrane recepter protein